MSIIEQLPNGGAVVAIIAVVILFLRKQEKSDETIREIVNSFTSESIAARKEYREHVTTIMQMGLDAHHETRDAIRSLGDVMGCSVPRPGVKPK